MVFTSGPTVQAHKGSELRDQTKSVRFRHVKNETSGFSILSLSCVDGH